MIVSLEGDTATFKSSFIFSGILPIVCCAFDAGAVRALYGARHKTFAGIDIKVIQYPPDSHLLDTKTMREFWKRNNGRAITVYLLPKPIQAGVRLEGTRILWNTFTTIHNEAVYDKEIPTIGLDTGTLARRSAVDSHLESLQNDPKTSDRVQLLQVEYGKPNDMVRSVYSSTQNLIETYAAMGIQKHFIITHHLTNRRITVPDSKGMPTSIEVMGNNGRPEQELEGLFNTLRFVDIALRVEQTMVDGFPVASQKVPAVRGEYVKNGFDLSKKGSYLLNPDWNTLARDMNKVLHPDMRLPLREQFPAPDEVIDDNRD